MNDNTIYILPAEFVGQAKAPDCILNVGGVKVQLGRSWSGYDVYVRRASDDLSVIEIHLARHDGLAQEELDQENFETSRYPLGPKEYWRGKMVGKYGYEGNLMTTEEFEEYWEGDKIWKEDEGF